ncbi:AT-hook motif nuclear-localized protein 1-like [Typha angustifolia]|uniref:AT-hook motif nuclear-localized protein 1-like n=1 Tax=Typha angustifolia TaxID=59011 RepID=UPI003C2E353B
MEAREGGMTAEASVTGAAEAARYYQPPSPAAEATTLEIPGHGGTAMEALEVIPPTTTATEAVGPTAVAVATSGSSGMKKKRGRPRKYGPDGSLLRPLNPVPISSSVPSSEYTPATAVGAAMKRGRGRPGGYVSKLQYGFESLGEMVACSAGANFTPHVITVAAGEDVTMKIISFSQQGPGAICILSANGVISNVTLRQPDSLGGTLTYEGRFELLSLSGSFMPSENGGTKSRSGGMSVSLASPDGRVVGGGVAGLLVAASPIQVVVGSFLPSYQLEQKTKKPRLETASVAAPTAAIPISSTETVETYGLHGSTTPKLNITTSFRGENWVSLQSAPDSRNLTADANISVPGG